ncbi:MAG TPA: SDR family oxidoreductase [Acidimicrobiia bacterium]|nr:SDR family oxidoreductase [Acidimicrobiia bacterium]
MNRLEGKVLIVAGAGGAQGRAICQRAAQEGARIVAGDISRSNLDETLASLDARRDDVRGLGLDVTSAADWDEAVRVAEGEFGHLDVVIDAAAVLNREGVEMATPEHWRLVLEVNLIGAWLGLRQALPALRRSGGGSVIMLSSIDALIGRGGAVAYHASKGGLRQMVRTSAVELAPEGIRVNSVCPGVMVNTMQTVVGAGPPPVQRVSKTPLGRAGTPDDIAWAVVYLASDESGFVTGTDLVVDGGYTAQ